MSDSRHSERLLSDVLSEGTAADFREGLLNHTLRLAHRRRRFRQARRATSALAVVVGLGLLVWYSLPSIPRATGLPAKPYAIVRTQPLPREAWVETKSLPASSIFGSLRTENIILTAEAASPVRPLSDDELLALAPQPAALVRFGPHAAELVLVNRDGTEDSLRN